MTHFAFYLEGFAGRAENNTSNMISILEVLMQTDGGARFHGFSRATIDFLRDIKINNNKAWFETNKARYEDYVLQPIRELVQDLGGYMLTIDPLIEITPAVDKTISRIYRDVRFSPDKSPYKTSVWITFRRAIKEWKQTPCYFFEIMEDSYRYGMGFYMASPNTMDVLRDDLECNNTECCNLIAAYNNQSRFVLEGEQYKRLLNGLLSPEYNTWYQRKNIYLICNHQIDDAEETLFSWELTADLMQGFGALAPFYHYFWSLVNRRPFVSKFR